MKARMVDLRAVVVPLALSLVAPALAAQAVVQVAPGVAGQFVRLRAEVPGETDLLSGAVVGVEGALMLGKLVQLEVQYLQGTLHPDSGPAGNRDLTEGRVFLGLAPVRWFAMSVGPHVRSYGTAAGTERWVRWEARARAQAPIALPGLTGYIEGWRVISVSANVPGAFDRGQGGEAGIAARLPRGPGWWARLAYGVDRVALTGRRETLETVVLAIGVGLR